MNSNLPTARIRRAGNRSVMDGLADLSIIAATLFWLAIHSLMLLPQTWPATPATWLFAALNVVFVIVLSINLALLTPAFLAQLLPGTAAGMYLHKLQRATLAFGLLAAAAAYLLYHSGDIMYRYWMAQPDVVANGLVWRNTVLLLIVLLVPPTLAWTASTPNQWLYEVMNAHAVQKLRQQHAVDLALAEAKYARALSIITAGLDRATVAERQYCADVVAALHVAQWNTSSAIMQTLAGMANVRLAMPDSDPYHIARIEQLRQAIAAANVQLTPAFEQRGQQLLDIGKPQPLITPADEPLDAITDDAATMTVTDWDTPTTTTGGGDTVTGVTTTAREKAARAAHVLGSGDWSVTDVCVKLNVSESTARRYLKVWLTERVAEPGAKDGNYHFVERMPA